MALRSNKSTDRFICVHRFVLKAAGFRRTVPRLSDAVRVLLVVVVDRRLALDGIILLLDLLRRVVVAALSEFLRSSLFEALPELLASAQRRTSCSRSDVSDVVNVDGGIGSVVF